MLLEWLRSNVFGKEMKFCSVGESVLYGVLLNDEIVQQLETPPHKLKPC